MTAAPSHSFLTHSSRFVAALCLAVSLPPAWADKRVALVIGNAQYQQEATLRNPLNDAQLLARTLKDKPLQFDEVLTLSNGNRAQMLQQLARFAKLAQGADAAVLYYSGHGMINSKRQNHVLPVDMPKLSANADLDIDAALKAYGVSETELIDAVEGAKVQVVVLDACRDNGFGTQKSGSKGLARRADQSKNRLIAYATEEGFTAEDGKGQNSTYAQSLAKHLVRTDLPLLTVFDEVANDVEKQTANKQSPTRSGNLRTSVYLVAGGRAEPVVISTLVSVAPPTPAPVPVQPAAAEQSLKVIDGRYAILTGGAEVKDVQTTLIWQRCAVGQQWIGESCAGEAKRFEFADAQKQAANAWRVPGIRELASLILCSSGQMQYSTDVYDGRSRVRKICDGDFTRPTINTAAFPNTPATLFWPSSVNDDGYPWGVGLTAAKSSSISASAIGQRWRLVRSSQ